MPAEENVNEHIVVITGASPLDPAVLAWIPPDALVIAVDGGLDHALNVGLEPRYLVGDLDSVTDEGLTWAARHASIDRHPTDKDRTDTELALVLAATLDPDRITLIGGGDRLDHTIAAIGSLGALSVTSVPTLDAWWGTSGSCRARAPPRSGWCLARRCRCSPSTVRARTSRCAEPVGSSIGWTSSRSSASA
jgi:hypothetical protein